MTAQDLYDEITEALHYFDLRFADKDQIKVTLSDGYLIFDTGHRQARVLIPQETNNV